MTVIPWVVAVIALLAAYLAVRRTGALDVRLGETQRELQRVRAELEEVRHDTDARLKEIRQQSGGEPASLRFRPGMTIAEAMSLHPGVADVLSSFHLNGCSSCAISDVDTLEGACRSYGVDEAALMAALDGLLQPGAGDLLQMARSRLRPAQG